MLSREPTPRWSPPSRTASEPGPERSADARPVFRVVDPARSHRPVAGGRRGHVVDEAAGAGQRGRAPVAEVAVAERTGQGHDRTRYVGHGRVSGPAGRRRGQPLPTRATAAMPQEHRSAATPQNGRATYRTRALITPSEAEPAERARGPHARARHRRTITSSPARTSTADRQLWNDGRTTVGRRRENDSAVLDHRQSSPATLTSTNLPSSLPWSVDRTTVQWRHE